jgi:flagellar biosynthesis protein FliQ
MNELPSALMREGFTLLATTAGPLIGVLLLTGLIVGIMQAATQINDPAVGFLPRFGVALVSAWALGGWILERYSHYFANALDRMAAR